jgi:hypothetical protein
MEKTPDKATAMAENVAAALDPTDIHASARACADGFNRVFSLEWGLTAQLVLVPLACFGEDEKTLQTRL